MGGAQDFDLNAQLMDPHVRRAHIGALSIPAPELFCGPSLSRQVTPSLIGMWADEKEKLDNVVVVNI